VSNAVLVDPDVFVMLACCVLPTICKVTIHPVFEPNDFLLK
jgi:hypothetical protein